MKCTKDKSEKTKVNQGRKKEKKSRYMLRHIPVTVIYPYKKKANYYLRSVFVIQIRKNFAENSENVIQIRIQILV
jgi:hypothetical protein